MSEQPEALRLADILDDPEVHYPGNFDTPKRANAFLSGLAQEASDELRRQHEENIRLRDRVEWLEKGVAEWREMYMSSDKQAKAARATARVAIGHLAEVLRGGSPSRQAQDWLESIGGGE